MRAHACGFGLVETMVALALGLFVVACATVLLQAGRLDSRHSLAGQRVTQDLRHAAEQIARNLRRAGHWGGAQAAVGAGAGSGAADNPYAALTATNGTLAWRWSRDAVENGSVDTNEQFALRLAGGAVQFQFGAAGWQTMTDASTVVVTTLALVPQVVETPLPALCDAACAPGDAACPPRHVARRVAVSLAGRAPGDAAVVRRFDTTVRLRNDLVVGRCS
jgi:prepilin peptidase dependent protein B